MTVTDQHTIDVAMTMKAQIGLDAWLAVSAREQRAGLDEDGNVILALRFGPRHGLKRIATVTYRAGRDTYDVRAYKVHRNGLMRTITFGKPDDLDHETCDWTDVHAEDLGRLIRRANLLGDLS